MSIMSSVLYGIMKIIRFRESNDKAFLAEVKTGIHRDKRAKPFPTQKLAKRCIIETKTVLGDQVFTLNPRSGKNNGTILYLHGGAYLRRAAKQHWDFVYSLVYEYGYQVVFPDYPVAPEKSYRDVFEMTAELYHLLAEKSVPGNIILMGDSAGAGLALAFAQKLRDEQGQKPKHIVLLSPWLDVSMSNPEIPDAENKDPFLMARGLKAAGEAYAKGISTKNPLVSPIYGDLHNLGQLTLFTGTYDLLNPDARKLKGLCDQQGIKINYFEYPKMIHDWMIFGFPESKKVLQQINQIIMGN